MMTTRNSAKLYTPQVLALAVDLAHYPLTETFAHFAEAQSPTCGSTIRLGVDCDKAGAIAKLGMAISACAIGQASAAIFARSALGMDAAILASDIARIGRWLDGEGTIPPIASFEVLTAAQAYPARRGAILLPWRAAQRALSNSAAAS